MKPRSFHAWEDLRAEGWPVPVRFLLWKIPLLYRNLAERSSSEQCSSCHLKPALNKRFCHFLSVSFDPSEHWLPLYKRWFSNFQFLILSFPDRKCYWIITRHFTSKYCLNHNVSLFALDRKSFLYLLTEPEKTQILWISLGPPVLKPLKGGGRFLEF